MLSNEDHPGIFTFLVGMVIVVLVGVALSMMVTRRLKYSTGAADLQQEINRDTEEIAELAAQHDENARLFDTAASRSRVMSGANGKISQQAEAVRRRVSELKTARNQLVPEIASLADQFSAYRENYRHKTWTGAVGEKLGELTLRTGRVYHEAVISRVTDVGLEIHHQTGIATVRASDLEPKFGARFQWHEANGRERLKNASEDPAAKVGGTVVEDPSPPAPAPEP